MKTYIAITLLLLVATFSKGAEWEHLEDCELVPSFLNDGDSFLIRHGDKESVFRLYFVDCPEVSAIYPDRIKDQCTYFNQPKPRVLELGGTATRFTASFLNGKFSVYTKWDDALGQVKRYAAIIVKDGKTLSKTLAENGLVRVHGIPIKGKWKGRDADSLFNDLRKAERRAKENKLGGWAATNSPIKTVIPIDAPDNFAGTRQIDTDLSELININLATLEELDILPAVGPTTAQKIIDGRPYKDVESIRNVSGIGDVKMVRLKPLITVININAPESTADYYRTSPKRYLNRLVEVYIKMVVDVNWPAPDGFVVLQANTYRKGVFGGAIPLFFPEEKLEDILRFYGDKPADELTRTKAVFHEYNGELVLIIPRTPK